MKLDLLTNATVVDDAIRFVAAHNINNNNISSKEEESKQSDLAISNSTEETTNEVFE
jgi:hypothetical protein